MKVPILFLSLHLYCATEAQLFANTNTFHLGKEIIQFL